MDAISLLAAEPERAAIVLDVDGTLAPIVPQLHDAAVPEETRRELRRLAARYALLAFLTGRMAEDARKVVGLDGTYVGVHGLELDPEAERWKPALQEFARADWRWGQVEDKGVAVAFHWRIADDQDAAVADAEALAGRAERAGLVPRYGLKALELRPPVDAHKGTAVRRLVEGSGVDRALFVGDDTTDLDAFRGLRAADLELAVCVAVASDEGPSELRDTADLVVDGPTGVLELLRQL